MAKILHSENFIKQMINMKNQKNYAKNGGGYMAYINNINDKEGFFEKMKTFLESEESNIQEEKNVEQTTQTHLDDFEFQKDYLAEELSKALESFDLSKAKKIKEQIDNLSLNSQDKTLTEKEKFFEELKALKQNPDEEIKDFILKAFEDEMQKEFILSFLLETIKND